MRYDQLLQSERMPLFSSFLSQVRCKSTRKKNKVAIPYYKKGLVDRKMKGGSGCTHHIHTRASTPQPTAVVVGVLYVSGRIHVEEKKMKKGSKGPCISLVVQGYILNSAFLI